MNTELTEEEMRRALFGSPADGYPNRTTADTRDRTCAVSEAPAQKEDRKGVHTTPSSNDAGR